MPSCQTFKNTLGNIKLDDLQGLLAAYIASPSQQEETAIVQQLQTLKYQRSAFVKEYQEKTIEILTKWCPNDDFLDSIAFDEDSQRVIVSSLPSLNFAYTCFPSIIKEVAQGKNFIIAGACKIPSLDYLEKIGCSCSIRSKALTSMRRLKEAEDTLEITASSITSLPSLEFVGKLSANSSSLSSLPKLREADSLILDYSQITDLDCLENVKGCLRLGETPFRSAKKLRSVGNYIRLSQIQGTFQQMFPSLVEVGAQAQTDCSFYVPNEDLKKIIEDLRQNGKIKFSGDIKVE